MDRAVPPHGSVSLAPRPPAGMNGRLSGMMLSEWRQRGQCCCLVGTLSVLLLVLVATVE